MIKNEKKEGEGEKISNLLGGFVLDFGGIVKRDLGTEVVKLLLGLGVKILQPAVQLDEERKVCGHVELGEVQ